MRVNIMNEDNSVVNVNEVRVPNLELFVQKVVYELLIRNDATWIVTNNEDDTFDIVDYVASINDVTTYEDTPVEANKFKKIAHELSKQVVDKYSLKHGDLVIDQENQDIMFTIMVDKDGTPYLL